MSGRRATVDGDRARAGAADRGSPGTSRLTCSGVSVRFGGVVALDDVGLAVPPATIVGLVGPNGAGKSTLFDVLSGLIRPTGGEVLLDGHDVTRSSSQERAVGGLARTFQHPEVFAGLTVREHLTLGYRVRHARRRVWSDLFTMGGVHPHDPSEQTHVNELLELLGLQPVANRPGLGLPLGVARLVELGRALATSPTVLLLDEPSSGLDASETEQFAAALRRVVQERGTSVLLVEHDVQLVMRMCSTVYVLDFGVMVASGSPHEIRTSPAVRAAYLGEAVSAAAGQTPEDMTVFTASVPVEPATPRRAERRELEDQAPQLAVEDLSVRYGDALALSGVSFSVGEGQVLAVLGPNGAGKSSLARALCGLVRASSGRILLSGEDVRGWPAHRIRRAGLVHLPEQRGVFRGLTVIDNLRMAVADVRGRDARHEAVESALTMFPNLAARRRLLAGRLSGGEQQMLSLARALVTSPKLVVADEMSLGLAPKALDMIFEGLDRARHAGVTVIMIEQYVHRALTFADQCLVLQRGALAWKGPANEAGNELLRHYLGGAMAAGA